MDSFRGALRPAGAGLAVCGGNGGTLTINGGLVTAANTAIVNGGAGVGGGAAFGGNAGNAGNGGTVVMSGGELRATGTSDAAIGGGHGGSGAQGAAATVDLGTFAYEWSRTSADSVYQPGATTAFANNNNAGFAGIRPAGTYTLSADPASVTLPERTEGYDVSSHPSSATVTVTNTGDRKITVSCTTAATDPFAVSITPTELAPGGQATLTITAKNTCAVGDNQCYVTVNGSNGASVQVPVSFIIRPALAITSFADQSIVQGETATLTANVTGGAGDISYEWSWTDGSGPHTTTTTVNTLEVNPDATTTYTVTVTDEGFGVPATDDATVTVAAQDRSISLSPDHDWDFGTQTVGYTPADLMALDATVSNTGNVATGDLAVALSGANSNSFTLSKTSLPSIAKGGPDVGFTVLPKTGLAPVGDAAGRAFSATVTVSGQGLTSHSFNVSFTVQRAAVHPPASQNSITGIIAGQKYRRGPALTFTAHGGSMDSNGYVIGDTRWSPSDWSVNPSGDFGAGMTQSFETATMTLGAHMLTVNFVEQGYEDVDFWVNTGATDTKTVSFVLTEPAAPPKTSDDANLWLWIGLGLACAAGVTTIVVAGVKRRKR